MKKLVARRAKAKKKPYVNKFAGDMVNFIEAVHDSDDAIAKRVARMADEINVWWLVDKEETSYAKAFARWAIYSMAFDKEKIQKLSNEITALKLVCGSSDKRRKYSRRVRAMLNERDETEVPLDEFERLIRKAKDEINVENIYTSIISEEFSSEVFRNWVSIILADIGSIFARLEILMAEAKPGDANEGRGAIKL